MITAKADALVFQDIEPVFRFVALDFMSNYPRWSPEVIDLEPLSTGPIQPGYQARQIRVDQGHKTESTFEVAELIPLKRVSFKGITAPYCSIYEFADCNSSTQLSFTFELHQLDFLMRPFEKLIRAALQDGAERVVRNLKRLVESEHTPSSQRPPGPPDRAS